MNRPLRFDVLLIVIALSLAVGCSHRAGAAAPQTPAKLGEASKVIDFREIPLPADAESLARRVQSSLSFTTPGKAEAVFATQKKFLLDGGWKLVGEAYVSEYSCSATLAKAGYKVSLSTMPEASDKVRVTLSNHGNVDLASLPVPAAAKLLAEGPANVIYVSELSVDDAVKDCEKLLADAGWQPYGIAGPIRFYKQNAVRLTAHIAAAPAQGGKTTIMYSTELMSADLPAPAETSMLQYADTTTELSFETSTPIDEVEAFYQLELAKQGWKPTTENALRDGKKVERLYRNAENDLLTLSLQPIGEQVRGALKFQTAKEVKEIEQRLREKFKKQQ